MAKIESIEVNVETGPDPDAGTDGSIYLGFCGREFSLDSSSDDFERNSTKKYIFGQGSNVSNATRNDPRNPQLMDGNIAKFPVYIRIASTDLWQLERVVVTYNGEPFRQWDTSLVVGPGKLWLGPTAGTMLHIPKDEPLH